MKKYIFISTCSVYEDSEKKLKDESSPIHKCNIEDYDDETNESYGKRKSRCEEILKSSNLNYTILRPSLVFGKYDHTSSQMVLQPLKYHRRMILYSVR